MDVDAGTYTVIGGAAGLEDVAAAMDTIERTLFLDLPDFSGTGLTFTQVRSRLLLLDDRIEDIEWRAWRLAKGLIASVQRTLPLRSNRDSLALAKRLLYSRILQALCAEERARLASERIPPGASVRLLGLDDLHVAAFTHFVGNIRGSEDMSLGAPSPALVMRARASGFASLARDAWRVARRQLRVLLYRKRILREALRGQDSSDAPWLAVYIGHAVHDRIVGQAIRHLQAEGWRVCRVDTSPGGVLADSSAYDADAAIRLDMVRSIGGLHRWMTALCLRIRRSTRATALDFLASSGLSWCARSIFGSMLRLAAVDVQAAQDLHSAVLKAIDARTLLTLNETNLHMEAAAHVASRLGIPSVNVQHGVIQARPLRAEFGFDAFCVFGEAYREALIETGTAAERVVVIGDPRLDVVERQASTSTSAIRTVANTGRRNTDAITVVYVAQYANYLLSRARLFASFEAALLGTRRAGARMCLKLHPAGAGRDSVYSLVMAVHPECRPVLLRDEPLLEVLGEADGVLTLSSSTGFEAVALRKPLLVVDTMSGPLVPFVEEGVANLASSEGDVAQWVEALRAGSVPTPDLQAFNERFHYRLDARASQRLAALVTNLADKATES